MGVLQSNERRKKNASSMPEPKVLLDRLAYVESPRWHEGRLWFAHWGTGEIVAVDLDFPNGMVVTPDNSTLIISESFTGRLIAFDIEADGSLSNRRVWAEGLGPDGICMDAEGAIWTGSGSNAVVRVREGGEVL